LADVALEEEEETWVQVERDKVTPIPQALDSLVVVWETAEVDLLTRLLCSGPQAARMQQTLPAEQDIYINTPLKNKAIFINLLSHKV
jgi:hypothetical protein